MGGGAKSYDDEKAWSSMNHSILSGTGSICEMRFANKSVRAEMNPNGKKTLKLGCRNPYSTESTFQTNIRLRVPDGIMLTYYSYNQESSRL